VTARSEILAAIPAAMAPDGTFSIQDVWIELERRGTRYSKSTIQTHIASRMCASAPAHHVVRYPDLVRVRDGVYRVSGERSDS
jgi:hypothetical protein